MYGPRSAYDSQTLAEHDERVRERIADAEFRRRLARALAQADYRLLLALAVAVRDAHSAEARDMAERRKG